MITVPIGFDLSAFVADLSMAAVPFIVAAVLIAVYMFIQKVFKVL